MKEINITLSGILDVVRLIYENVKRMEANKMQCTLLLERIDTVVLAIAPISNEEEEQQKKLLPGLMALQRCLKDFNIFLDEFSHKNKLGQFFYANKYSEKMNTFNTELMDSISVLNLSVDIRKFSDPAQNMRALHDDLEYIKSQQSQIFEHQHIQTSLLHRMEHKLGDPKTSQDIRELKQAQAIQYDFTKRIEAALSQQGQQATQTEQSKQSDLLQLIHKELSEVLKRPAINPKDITTIKHEQMLVISMLQELQQDVQAYKQRTDHSSTLAHYTQYALHETEVLLEKAIQAKKQNDFTTYYTLSLQAATLGYSPAKAHVGSCLLQGKGTEKNPTGALPWLTQAAEAGEPRAMYNLARMSETGVGTTINIQLAAIWYERAANQTTSSEVAAQAKIKCTELASMVNTNFNRKLLSTNYQ